jgi:hypothetical protein
MTSREYLSDLKESNPVQVAKYAVTREIDHEPAFSWWVDFTLKKRERIIAAVNQLYLKKTHKFGVRMPKRVTRKLSKLAPKIEIINGRTPSTRK